MRLRKLARAVVGLTVAGGVAITGLSGTSFATSAPSPRPAASPQKAELLAVVNLGLSNKQAKYVQCFLSEFAGYDGSIDGQLGPQSWKDFQWWLSYKGGYKGNLDGIVGSGTVSALQRVLREYGYSGAIDGIAGSGTQAAFKKFANYWASLYPC
ncbi:peptidoglycan-binding protein [Streptomyces sp. NPDC059631]|uniref:peptidoglycan-binding domain-containing protein n=1 Tax=unclassified Streptomyces TaxID=2593676 RepID=UPI0036B49872